MLEAGLREDRGQGWGGWGGLAIQGMWAMLAKAGQYILHLFIL